MYLQLARAASSSEKKRGEREEGRQGLREGEVRAMRPSPPCHHGRGAPRQRARRDVRGVGVGMLEFELLSGLDGS